MAKTNITQYDSTPSNNADINSINIAENCPASNINNAIRELMAHLKNMDTGSQALTALSVAGNVTASTSLKTPLIEFTDGDDALTIADGGNVTANADFTVSGAFTSQGIDDNADATAITIDSSENVTLGSGKELRFVDTNESIQSDGSKMIIKSGGTTFNLPTSDGTTGQFLKTDGSGTLSFDTVCSGASLSNGANNRVITATGSNAMTGESNFTYDGTTIDLNGSTNYTAMHFRINQALQGSITVFPGGTSYNASSDYRLKENITQITDATTRLKKLKPCRFNFRADNEKIIRDGFIAHEVSDIVPEAITGEKDAVDNDGNIIPQGIDQSKLIPLLVKTIQELEARITILENA